MIGDQGFILPTIFSIKNMEPYIAVFKGDCVTEGNCNDNDENKEERPSPMGLLTAHFYMK